MKKLSRVLSVFMAALVVLSSFGVCASAVSSKSTPEELLAYYHKALEKNSAKDIIRGNGKYSTWDEYDLSGLSGKALAEVKAEIADESTEKYESESTRYFEGDKFVEESGEKSQFVSYFDITRDIESSFYTLKSASYTKNQDGSEKITFRCERGPADTPYKSTYTVRISKTGYVTHYAEKRVGVYDVYSKSGYKYKFIQTTMEEYEFLCLKVPVTSIQLSETSLELEAMESKTIQVKIGPENATFKDYDAYLVGDTFAFDLTESEDSITVTATSSGVATVVVTDVAENVVATCTVTCEMNFFQRIAYFFRLMYILFLGSFAL